MEIFIKQAWDFVSVNYQWILGLIAPIGVAIYFGIRNSSTRSGNKQRKRYQDQKITGGSTGIQAGGNVNITK